MRSKKNNNSDNHNTQYMTYILRPNQLLKMRETLRSIFIFPNESKHKIAERISVTAAEKNNNTANKKQGVTLSRRFVALVENLLNLGYEIKTKVRDENGHPVYHGNSCCSSYGHTPCHNYMTFFKIYCCLNDQNLFLMKFLLSSLYETTFTVRQMSDKCNSCSTTVKAMTNRIITKNTATEPNYCIETEFLNTKNASTRSQTHTPLIPYSET